MLIPDAWLPAVKMDRIISHWTAGGHKANATDRNAYHVLVEGDGSLVRGNHSIAQNAQGAKGARANHTLNCNTGSIGVSMCCMAGAREVPFDAGKSPMTKVQWDAMVRAIAQLCRHYGIPVTPRTVLSHAEVQANLGIAQRAKWDFTALPFDGTKGAKVIGDRMRREVLAAMKTIVVNDKPLGKSRTLAGAGLTAFGTAGSAVSEAAEQVAPLAGFGTALTILFVALTLIGIGLVVYARVNDAGKI